MSWLDDLTDQAEHVSHDTRTYVAWLGEAEFSRAKEDDATGRTVRLRIVRPPEKQHEAHPFAKFTRRRRGKGGTRFEIAFAEIDGPREMMLEVILLGWASNPKGDFVDFLLNGEHDKHPFMGCVRPSADSSGTRWMITAVEKDDDEQIVNQGARDLAERNVRHRRQQTLSNVARIITKNSVFHEFLRETEDETIKTVADADSWLKAECGIASKTELDTKGPEGVRPIAKFHKIRARFTEWQTRNGYDPISL